jgi:hypothetical protein
MSSLPFLTFDTTSAPHSSTPLSIQPKAAHVQISQMHPSSISILLTPADAAPEVHLTSKVTRKSSKNTPK